MAKHYLDNITFNSKSQGVNESLSIRDTEARALIQTNANAIAEVTAKEARDRVDINKNKSDIAKLNSAVERIDQKDTQQHNRLVDIEAKNAEQDNRLTAAETEITSLDARMESAENNISALDTRVTATETKNTEQDGRLDRVEEKNTEQDNRITKNESDIASLDGRVTVTETDITNIKAKDEEQDAHLTELDDKVAASTYEAGIGIYFGQGKVHTNINVEDEILDQINQNTIDIDILKNKKPGTKIIKNFGPNTPDNNIYDEVTIGEEFDPVFNTNNPRYGIYVDDKNVIRVTPTFWSSDPLSNNDARAIRNVILNGDFTITELEAPDSSKYARNNIKLTNNGGAIFANVAFDKTTAPVEGTASFILEYIEAAKRHLGPYVDGKVIDIPFNVQYFMDHATISDPLYSTTAVVNVHDINVSNTFEIHFLVYNAEVTKPYIVDAYWNRSNDTWTFNKHYVAQDPEPVNVVASGSGDGYATLIIS